ncbi:MAG: bacteriophage abortive infection AbiH family protein [Bacteroidales bacterium]|nr:bacteriophage abortive infection AbiH family protein [Bacteroidales bacterium]
MNRLVLIGNGFDLAHGLKTSYADFINWYWEQRVNGFRGNLTNVSEDPLCTFELYDDDIRCWNVFAFHLPRFINKPLGKDVIQSIMEDTSRFKATLSPFFERIIKSIETKGWVDIENEYYSMLVREKDYGDRIKTLNNHLDFLREKLIEYLNIEKVKSCTLHDEIKDKIYRPIESCELSVKGKQMPENYYALSKIMLLNFNYTSTPEMYLSDKATVNYIHGNLEDPQSVIFGYGDELDENYKKLKEQNDFECMRQVKSIRYLEHDNYRRMLEFIESAPFQAVIMGHSCGNSDRTLLNTIFEHPNCVSIKPYYYLKDDRTDTYSELTISINRNFSNPKKMRDRVVNKDYTEPLTNSMK